MRAAGTTVAFAVLLLAAPLWDALRARPEPEPFAQVVSTSAYPIRGVLFGDTRGQAVVEFWRADNSAKRADLLRAIAGEAPAFVFNSGDLVLDAASVEDWAAFDADHAPFRERRIPYFVAYGNHEYVGRRDDADAEVRRRFPAIRERTWFDVPVGNVLFLALDSNFEILPADAVREQDEWLESRLAAAEGDASVARIFLVFHHPPYTNSVTHQPCREAQEHFLARARGHAKVKAFWCGHVHTYEHFLVDGVHFVNSGGGGAPTTHVWTGDRVRMPDLYPGGPWRGMHYNLLTIHEDRVEVEVKMMREGGGWETAERYAISD